MARLPATWPNWDVSDAALREMREHFPNALYGDIPRSVQSARDVVALEKMLGAAEVTRILSGTTDRKSKEWKSAQRQQQRYRRGERGTKGIAPNRSAALTAAARKAARARFDKSTGPLPVSMSLTWLISRDAKKSTPHANLTGEALDAFKAAVSAGRYVRAVQIVTFVWGLDPREVVELIGFHGVRIG